MLNLHTAAKQWSDRPNDERFWDLNEMHDACSEWRSHSAEAHIRSGDVKVTAEGDEIFLTGPEGIPAKFGNYAFEQTARLAEAPVAYLRRLPPTLAADCLNQGIKARVESGKELQLLMRRNGGLHVRAVTSEKYSRLWNVDVIDKLMPLQNQGWRVPPARPAHHNARTRIATSADCLANRMTTLGVKPGDEIAPAGLYASDKDCFVFMVNENCPIDDGKGGRLFRGFFMQNSEVGDCAFKISTFLYNGICGNHIVWGAQKLGTIRVVHSGRNVHMRATRELGYKLRRYAEKSTDEERGVINEARAKLIGETEEEVIQRLFSRKIASRNILEGAYSMAVKHEEDGHADPKSIWGMTQGLTRLSQESTHTDARVNLDRAAGRVLQMAF